MKGIAIWIMGFFTFLFGANLVNSVIMWFNLGPTATFTPYLLGSLTGAVPIYVYFLISLIATLAFLGVTTHKAISELSNTEQINAINEKANRLESGQQSEQKFLEGIQARVFLVDENLEHTRKEFSNALSVQQGAIKQSLDEGQQTQQKMLDGVQGRVFLLDESLSGVKKGLVEQSKTSKEINENLVGLGPQLADIRQSVEKQHQGMENAFASIEQREKKTEATIAKQRNEIADLRSKIEELEKDLFRPAPPLTSQNNVEDVKGIGPGKGTELKEIGITNVGDLIMADPKVVAEKMGSTEKTVEKLQGRAQLLLVPGMKEKDLLLLEELDIIDRKSLAEQDPIELSKKVNAVFKVNLAKGKVTEADKPTIEDVDSWVRFSRS